MEGAGVGINMMVEWKAGTGGGTSLDAGDICQVRTVVLGWVHFFAQWLKKWIYANLIHFGGDIYIFKFFVWIYVLKLDIILIRQRKIYPSKPWICAKYLVSKGIYYYLVYKIKF